MKIAWLLSLTLAACSILPSTPTVMPPPGSSTAWGGVLGASVGPTQVTGRASPTAAPVTFSSSDKNNPGFDGGFDFLFPGITSMFTVAPDWWLRLSGSATTLGADAVRSLAPWLTLTLAAQTDGVAFLFHAPDGPYPGFAAELHAGITAQPTLGPFVFLAGADLGGGTFRHSVWVSPPLGIDFTEIEGPVAHILRPELRAEGVLGVGFKLGPFAGRPDRAMTFVFAAQPFAILAHGDPSFTCFECKDGVIFDSFSMPWGVAWTFTFLISWR